MSKVWFFNFTYSATKEEREGHTSLVTEKEDLNDIQLQSSSFILRFQTAYEEYKNNNSIQLVLTSTR
jgi:hypothetical protein